MGGEPIDVPLDVETPGTSRTVRMVRYGDPDARPKAYIQAGVHADETPGYLVARHLLAELDAAQEAGRIAGQVVVVPCANPLGLAQRVTGASPARQDLASGQNFNRGWPDLAAAAAGAGDRLGDDARANLAELRSAMRAALDAQQPEREIDALHRVLAREACDADLALDLHCDDAGLLHLFILPELWPAAADLAGELDCAAVLTAGVTGGSTFSETLSAAWTRLGAAHPDLPIPQGCVAATVELRGFADVDDGLAKRDARALVRALQRRGHLAGDPGPAPQPRCEPTGLDACDILRAPATGAVIYRAELGQQVRGGDPIAELVPLDAGPTARQRAVVHARTDGIVLTRRLHRQAARGDAIAKIAGRTPLAHRQGYLLED
ncbi:hypothetical protein SAMN05216241_10559 [Limimonas halophila]|uniref:Succinylglutamate desuccinylase/Aspartoacylase catalytic domain-containing protein n=1 Tax=Limimonas halophila TaxID=1082479 RepID=A0A1G7RAV1_9PROT|nr:succinylglutamate desuccinylase/aspartoacylase family protein [Limimonas halophila]SDG07804.1 hypothetical protein SAMN05216241_10559 [Limimonas halophila]